MVVSTGGSGVTTRWMDVGCLLGLMVDATRVNIMKTRNKELVLSIGLMEEST